MAANFVPPPMKTWAEYHLSSILKATTQNEFNDAFDAFLSMKATITVNGRHLSREEYKKMLQGEKVLESGASVDFRSAVDVPADGNSVQTGVVGLFYTATIREKIRRLSGRALYFPIQLASAADEGGTGK
ncbi:hypothetical protein MVEN_01832400 [Mycena venus]|uniref:Uncharacterized protein n=1 Tax=Mycena venus TaxID=2733690 RepID=A0A8H7CNI0_9AGAR|nr:hypothetical protein MVEN_01832400 [Mycena venus]